jgi:hypothetical protein
MSAGYYKVVNGEMLYGTKICSPTYTLTPKDTSKIVDGWQWFDKSPLVDITLPCGCVVKMLIDPKVETAETVQASVDAMAAKVIEGKAPVLSVSVVVPNP